MANVSSSNGLEKYPKLRFSCFDQPYTVSPLSNYLFENTERNRDLLFDKEDVLSVSGEFGVVNQIEFQGRSFAGESVAEYHVVNTNDVVYTKSPLKANPYGIIKTNKGVPGIVSTLYAVYHPNECVDPLYVEYYFGNDLRLNKFLKPLVNIGAKHDMKVNNEFVLTGEVCFPSVIEQQKVVEFLSCLDRRIEKQRTLVEHLKKYKRGVSIAIFDRKISLTKNSPTWIKTTVGEICKITMGQSPDSESYNTDQIGIPLVQGNADMKNRITCPQRYTSKPTKICHEGSIILSVRAPVGSVGRADRSVCLGRGVCAINSDNNDFLYYFFERNEPYWKRIEQGGTFTAISGDDIADMPIDYPSYEERQKIADFLLKIDTHIAVEENTLNQLVALKSGLLQQLFI